MTAIYRDPLRGRNPEVFMVEQEQDRAAEVQRVMDRLRAPFEPADLEWRLLRAGEKDGKPWGICVPYFKRDALINRLDSAVGPANWQTELRASATHVFAGIGLLLAGVWVWRWDGSGMLEDRGEKFTAADAGKGDVSMALKRASEQWGIGLYLREIPGQFVIINDQGRYRAERFRWDPPGIPQGTPSRPGSLPPEDPKSTTPPAKLEGEKSVEERIEYAKAQVRQFLREHHFQTYHLEAVMQTEKRVRAGLIDQMDVADWEAVLEICRRSPTRFDEAMRLLAQEYPTDDTRVKILKHLMNGGSTLKTGEAMLINSAIQIGWNDGVEYWIQKLEERVG